MFSLGLGLGFVLGFEVIHQHVLCTYQGFIQDFFVVGGGGGGGIFCNSKINMRYTFLRGVWGHAPCICFIIRTALR